MMKLGSKGLELIKSFESFVPYVYDDKIAPVKGVYREWDGGAVKGTLTIGYGHTNAAKHPLKIYKGLRIDEQKALEILDVDLDECKTAVNSLVTVNLHQGQFDALVSFTFNCGIGNLKKVIVPLNKGNYDATCAKIGEYIRSKGEVMRGLVRRRKAEQALFNDQYDVKEPEAEVQPIPKVEATDAPSMTGKLTESTTVWASIGTIIATVAASVTDWKIMAVIGATLLAGWIIWQRSKRP